MAGMESQFNPGTSSLPKSDIELSISCRKLIDADILSKSDPICVLYTQPAGTNQWREKGRTEMVKDCLNPDFVRKFNLTYYFEEIQNLKFEVYDVDGKSNNLNNFDFLGESTCTLGEIIAARGARKIMRLSKGRKSALIVTAEEIQTCNDIVWLKFKAIKVDKKDFMGKSDPFLCFYRSLESGESTLCHKTECIKNTLNPEWQMIKIPARTLCMGDFGRMLKIVCYDWNRSGDHSYIGEVCLTVNELLSGYHRDQQWPLMNTKKQAKHPKKYKNSGLLKLQFIKLEENHTFMEFVRGGMQLSFVVSLDFTASNGDPRQLSSLHYISPYHPNQYQLALEAIGRIIQDYDSDKLFPCFGFGGKIMPVGQVSHLFPLNGCPDNPLVEGLGGILNAYNGAIQQTQLHGPTNFSPSIEYVANLARNVRAGSEYFVLLIITDGVISDMPMTLESIVRASILPMSIIIVGVGDADFHKMDILDGDDVRVSSNGRQAERDIVQFVPFRDFVRSREAMNNVSVQARLAAAVLEEIPDQVTGFMKGNNLKPSQATLAPDSVSLASTVSVSGDAFSQAQPPYLGRPYQPS